MVSLSLFRKSSKSPAPVPASAARADGYDARAAAVCCRFQAIVEAESDVDYDALRAALAWARVSGVVVTLPNLRAKYNDFLYASAEVAYSSR